MSTTLTRQELYDCVWAVPVDKLCKEFGLSNVGLGKACLSLIRFRGRFSYAA